MNHRHLRAPTRRSLLRALTAAGLLVASHDPTSTAAAAAATAKQAGVGPPAEAAGDEWDKWLLDTSPASLGSLPWPRRRRWAVGATPEAR